MGSASIRIRERLLEGDRFQFGRRKVRFLTEKAVLEGDQSLTVQLRVLVVQQDADEPHHLHKLSFTLLLLLLEVLHLLLQEVSLNGIIGGHVVTSDSLR